MSEAPNLDFPTPEFSYDELEAQLQDYVTDPERYPHDEASIISVEEAIRSGRNGNVAVGGCLYHNDELIHRDQSKALAPYHRTDLHIEMVLLNQLEDKLCDDPAPRMRDYTLSPAKSRARCVSPASASTRSGRCTTSTATGRARKRAHTPIETGCRRAFAGSAVGS